MIRDEIDDRLKEIFEDLFGLAAADIDRSLSPDTFDKWDSLAHIKLVAAIEETFTLPLSPEDQGDMLSFELVGDIVAERITGK